MKYCMKCGKKMQDDDAFCGNCGFGSTADIDPFGHDTLSETVATDEAVADIPDISEEAENSQTWQSAAPTAASSAKYKKSMAQSVKSVMTGKRRGLVSSIIVLALSVVMLFVALFAPVKVADYATVMGDGSIVIDDVSGGTLRASYAEIEQSVFQIIGAFTYLNPSSKQEREIERQMSDATAAASFDLGVWMVTHPKATEFEVAKKQTEIYCKHLSDVNYFAYCMVKTKGDGSEAVRFKMLIFLCTTALVVLLLLTTAIVSLAYIIKCIVGYSRHKPDMNVSKYLKVMLGMTGATLLTSLLSPVTASSGSPFGLFIFVATCMVLWGMLSALCDGQNRLAVLKRVIFAAFAFTTFILLCCNCIKLIVEQDYLYVVSVKPNMGLAGIVAGMPKLTGSALVIAILYVLLGICGGITAYIAVAGTLKNVIDNNDKTVTLGVRAIALAVFAVAAIVIGFLFDALATSFDKLLGNTGGVSGVLVEVNMSVAGTVWAAAVLSVVTAVAAFVFRPKTKSSNGGDTAQPVEAMQPVEVEQSAQESQSGGAQSVETAE